MTMDSANDGALGMIKVYTQLHRLGSTIRKLKNYKSAFKKSPLGFHISYGPSKKQSYFLHIEYEKAEGQHYGGKSFEELGEWIKPEMDKLPPDIREKFIEKAKETW